MPNNPKVFVGSSSEAKAAARVLCFVLRDDAIMIPWWDAPEFAAGSFATLDSLLTAVASYDFAIFLLTPDDFVNSRGKGSDAPRDNVIFEFGLFLGQLGQERVFAFVQQPPAKGAPKIPSDLLGIHMPRFTAADDTHELTASLGAAAGTLRNAIKRCPDWWHLGLDVIRSWGLDQETFHVTLGETAVKRYATRFQQRSLLIAIRRHDDKVAKEHDKRIAVSKPRPYMPLDTDVELTVKSKSVITNAPLGTVIECHLFTVPLGLSQRTCTTITDIVEHGGRLIKSVGKKSVGKTRQRKD